MTPFLLHYLLGHSILFEELPCTHGQRGGGGVLNQWNIAIGVKHLCCLVHQDRFDQGVFFDPCRICTRSTCQKRGGKEKGCLNQGPWATSIILNQFTSELLHSVLLLRTPPLDLLNGDCTRNHSFKITIPTGSISDKKAYCTTRELLELFFENYCV